MHDPNEISEGEYLSDLLEDGWTAEEEERERKAREIAKLRSLNLYEVAKATKTGNECKCPGLWQHVQEEIVSASVLFEQGAEQLQGPVLEPGER